MFFKDFVSVKRQKIKRGASQTYDTPPTNAQHKHAISGDVAMLTQHLRRVLLAIVLGYHPQRGGTTVHLVELLIMWKWL